MTFTRLRTPASTSNLGPGFDFLGLALELWLEVERDDLDAHHHQLVRADDASATWPEAGNLLPVAFDAALRALGAEPRPSRFVVRSEIPLCRGLGSSGAAVAAGLMLGAAAAGIERPDLARLAELGLNLEGHPDNSTASLYGGCTLAVPLEGGSLDVVQQPLANSLRFAVAWSSSTLSTEDARSVLPESVPFADAVENPRRLALLLEGLRTGDPSRIAAGAVDHLHVRARTPLIPGGRETMDAARKAGAHAATVSGSGSALIAVHTEEGACAEVARAMEDALRQHNTWATARVLRSAAGAQLLPS